MAIKTVQDTDYSRTYQLVSDIFPVSNISWNWSSTTADTFYSTLSSIVYENDAITMWVVPYTEPRSGTLDITADFTMPPLSSIDSASVSVNYNFQNGSWMALSSLNFDDYIYSFNQIDFSEFTPAHINHGTLEIDANPTDTSGTFNVIGINRPMINIFATDGKGTDISATLYSDGDWEPDYTDQFFTWDNGNKLLTYNYILSGITMITSITPEDVLGTLKLYITKVEPKTKDNT